MAVPSIDTSTAAPASPVPETIGVESLVTDPSAGATITGASGAVASTVTVTIAGSEVFPASSVCSAVMLCEPSLSGSGRGSDQEPSRQTGAGPLGMPLTMLPTPAPGYPVPVRVGGLVADAEREA